LTINKEQIDKLTYEKQTLVLNGLQLKETESLMKVQLEKLQLSNQSVIQENTSLKEELSNLTTASKDLLENYKSKLSKLERHNEMLRNELLNNQGCFNVLLCSYFSSIDRRIQAYRKRSHKPS
jgi:predicted nuclease with TOPRIM domain